MKINKLIRKTREVVAGEEGFTMVELLIVMIMSLILIAGMVGLVEMAMKQFNNSREVEAITDASRRAMASMTRQVAPTLHLDDGLCSSTHLSFYADIHGNNPGADVNNYNMAEKVEFYLSGRNLVQKTTWEATSTDPESHPQNPLFVNLCSDVTNVTFHYFAKGVQPVYSGGVYTNETTSNYNSAVGMVKVSVTFNQGRVVRQFEQDIFLRILQRVD